MPPRWNKVHLVTRFVNQIRSSSSKSTQSLDLIFDNCHYLNNNTSYSSGETKQKRNNGSFLLIIISISLSLETKKVAFGYTLLAFLLWFLEVLLHSFRHNRVAAQERHFDKQNMVIVGNFVEIGENRGEVECNSKDELNPCMESEGNGEEKMMIKGYDRINEDTNQHINNSNTERMKSMHVTSVERNIVDGYPPLHPFVESEACRIQYTTAGIPERMSSGELRTKKSKKYVVKKLFSEKLVVKKVEVEKFVVKKFGSKSKRSDKNEGNLDPSIVRFSSEIENFIAQEKNEKNKHGKLERASSADIRREQIKNYFKKLGSKHKKGKEGKLDLSNVHLDYCSGNERVIRGHTGVKLDEEENIREAKSKFGDGYDLMNVLEVNENRFQNAKDGDLGRTTSADLKMKQFKKFVSKKFGRDSKRRGDKEGSLNPRTLHFECSPGMERVAREYVEEQEKNQEENDCNNEVEAKFEDGYHSIIMSEVSELLGDEYDLIDVTNNNEEPVQNARHGDLLSMHSAEPSVRKYVIKKVDSEKFSVKKFQGEELVVEKLEGECKDGRGNKAVELYPNNEQFICSPEIRGLITGGVVEEEDLESPEDSQSDDEDPEGEVVYQYDSICVSETSPDMIIQGNWGRSTNLSQHSFIPIVIILAGLLNGRIMALVLILLWFLLIKLHNQLQATHITEDNSYPENIAYKKSC